MKITNIRSVRTEHGISLRADCKIRPIGDDTIYFNFDSKYSPFLYEDASPFAAGLLVPCMTLGEDLHVDGPMSKKLYEGMHRVMDIMAGWDVGLRRIKIHASELTEDAETPRSVGTFFSGGLDSFYTYLKHKDDAQDPVSHLILINGSDISLSNRKLWDMTRKNVSDIATKGGIEMLAVETNLPELLEPMSSPEMTHGGSLVAVALCLRSGFKKIYIPASLGKDEQVPCGTHVDLDHHWNTETISFVHDGAEATRPQKTAQIAGSPVALEHLRVCYMNKTGAYNCGRCEKCMRTMMDLYLCGKLSASKTFPTSIDLKLLTSIAATSGLLAVAYERSLAVLRERRQDPQMQEALERGLAKMIDPTHTLKDKAFKKFLYVDHRYLRGKLHKLYRIIRR